MSLHFRQLALVLMLFPLFVGCGRSEPIPAATAALAFAAPASPAATVTLSSATAIPQKATSMATPRRRQPPSGPHPLYSAHVEFDRYTVHHWQSVTVSITSVLLGIAIERAAIDSIEENLFDSFPEYACLKDSYELKYAVSAGSPSTGQSELWK
jgi:hypothetical protein